MPNRFLTALPVYNEVAHVTPVLDEVRRFSPEVLVVDDGSNDGTADVLAARSDIKTLRHPRNRGYGAALKSAFDYALKEGYDGAGDHRLRRPARAAAHSRFVAACTDDVDIVSGSRYLNRSPEILPHRPIDAASIG